MRNVGFALIGIGILGTIGGATLKLMHWQNANALLGITQIGTWVGIMLLAIYYIKKHQAQKGK
jgi:hypothetical protein